MNNPLIYSIIKYLETKSNLTDYEKDILDSFRELTKVPEDKNGIIKQLINNKKYNLEEEEFALAEIQTQMQAVLKPLAELSIEELKGNLYNQLFLLCSKYKF